MMDLSFSDTEDISLDFQNDKPKKINEKRVYNKKNAFSEKELEQLIFFEKIKSIENEIEFAYDTIRRLKQYTKDLKIAYQHDINCIRKMKRYKENSSSTGFNKKIILPEKLCNLINVPKNTEMSIPEISKEIYGELKKRNLQYQEDKRIFRADKEFLEVFNLPESVNKSKAYPDKNGFNIGTMQFYIANILKNNEKKIKVKKAD